MKKMTTKLVLAGVLLSSAVSAQQIAVAPALKSNYVIGANSIQAKSTAVQSRVVGYSFLNYTNGFSYSLEDTAFLTYTGDRGSDSTLQVLKYDVMISQSVVANVLVNDEKSTQSFDADNNILTNLNQTWNVGTNNWDNNTNSTYTYDGDNNMLTSVSQFWNAGTNAWENDTKVIYGYDGNNNMLTRVVQYWDNILLVWNNNNQNIYSYDVDNHMTINIYQYWDMGASAWVNSSRDSYVYDVNGDLTTHLYQNWDIGTADWINSIQHIYTYDADHHMLTDVYQNDVAGVWVNSEKTTYSYTGDDATTIVRQDWNSLTNVWDNDSRELRSYDADHNMITNVYQAYNMGTSSFDNMLRVNSSYNSYNQLTTAWSDTWNAGIWQVTTSDAKMNYYYEEYGQPDEPQSVAGTATASDFNLYPVPAQSFVRIEKTWNTPQAFTVSVTDLQGRLIRTYSEKATTNYSRNIDVNQLATGNYVIKIATDNGKASYQQFSVVH